MRKLPLIVKISLCLCALLLSSAVAHKAMIGTEQYTSSFLIPIEIVSLGLVLLMGIFQSFTFLIYLLKQKWQPSIKILVSIIFAFASILLAVIIDGETLVYAT